MTPEEARRSLDQEFGVASSGSGASIAMTVPLAQWAQLGTFARRELGCEFFSFLTAVDWTAAGLEIVTRVENLDVPFALTMKTRLDPGTLTCPSLVSVYRGADWMEREAFDMFGVVFEGHPDLRRILLPDDWQGHPLLKSYAVDTPYPPYR